MIRLIVMYNLADGADEIEFLNWRLGPHQQSNAALQRVLRTDFGRVIRVWPEGADSRFRFVTTVEWDDRATFEDAFYAPEVQAELIENVKRLGDFEYSISEILTRTENIEVKEL